jgi:hypothetical protein
MRVSFEPPCITETPGRQRIGIRNETDEMLGSAELLFKENPIPHFVLYELYIRPGNTTRGHGYGSTLLRFIENQLCVIGKAGFLHDVVGINENNTKTVAGMYERHGWIPVPGRKRVFVYNLPQGVHADVFSAHLH